MDSKNHQQDMSEEAFGELVKLHHDVLYGFCFRRIRNPDSARDMTQEVYSRAWKKWLGMSHQPDNFAGWLTGFAHKVLQEHYRAKLRNDIEDGEVVDALGVPATQYSEVLAGECEQFIRTFFHDRPRALQIFLRAVKYGDEPQEIAELTGETPANVRVILCRVRRELRDVLSRPQKIGKSNGINTDASGKIKQAVRELFSPQDREIMGLAMKENKTPREIACQLKLSGREISHRRVADICNRAPRIVENRFHTSTPRALLHAAFV